MLSTPHRLTLTLLFENFCESAISEVLDLPVERVRFHIEHGKQQLGERFDEMRDSWRRQHVEVGAPQPCPGIRRRWPNFMLGLQLACATAGALTGVWLAYLAWRLVSLSFGVWAVVLLLTAPALGIVAFLARNNDLKWESESLESVLVSGRYRAEASLRAIRLGRGYTCVVASHIAVLWVSELGGLINARAFLIIYSVAWAVMAVLYLPWLTRRERTIYEEHAITSRLLGEVTSMDD